MTESFIENSCLMDNPEEIHQSIQKRSNFFEEPHDKAFRLINGFTENMPNIVLEVFAKTLVYYDYSKEKNTIHPVDQVIAAVREKLPWLESVVVKKRRVDNEISRNGRLVFGDSLDNVIKENGILYAIDLTMNQDSSFYLDTRNLRIWLKKNMAGRSILNAFAYTGSLGVAALMGEASELVQLDLNWKFLNIAKRSVELNKKQPLKSQCQRADFWTRINHFKNIGKTFDCVILDPPVYAKTQKGCINLTKNYNALINKVRPIINHNGYLITINNALFQSGQAHQEELEQLCQSGYLKIEERIDVPEDCIGDASAINEVLPSDPMPYNHSTKITILSVKKKVV